MAQATTFAALRATALAAELSHDQVRKLAGVTTARTVADGEVLIEPGSDESTLYAVADGYLAIERPGGSAPAFSVDLIGKGELVGEIGFLDGLKRTARVRADGPATVVVLDRAQLESLLPDDPWLVYRIMRAVVRSMYAVVVKLDRERTNHATTDLP